MRRSTFVKFALPTMLALAAAWACPAMAQAGKVIKMIPGGDLKIIDPIQDVYKRQPRKRATWRRSSKMPCPCVKSLSLSLIHI